MFFYDHPVDGIKSFWLACFIRSCLKNSFPIFLMIFMLQILVVFSQAGPEVSMILSVSVYSVSFQLVNIYKLLMKEIFLIFFRFMYSANSFSIVSLSQYFLYLDGRSRAKMYKRQMSNPLISPLGP